VRVRPLPEQRPTLPCSNVNYQYSFNSTQRPVFIQKHSQYFVAQYSFCSLNINTFSERSLYAIARPSVVCLSSVTFVRPIQAVQIFSNISTALGTLAIR